MVTSTIQYIGGVPSSWLGREGLCPKVRGVMGSINVFRSDETTMTQFPQVRMVKQQVSKFE